MKNVIRIENISKGFGKVMANEHISLNIKKGEVHALLGENGAGKSTLMNMLSGIYIPDSGSIYIDDKKVSFSSPQDAIKVGIGMVHQHFKLIEGLTAAQNIAAGSEGSFFMNMKKISDKIRKIGEQTGLVINPDQPIHTMSVSEKQTVEIIKVLYRGARILILDEPTAVLTPQESRNLFNIINKMKSEGVCILIITHKLYEVMEISDRVTVLRKGKTVGTVFTKDTTPEALTHLMVGKEVSFSISKEHRSTEEVVLSLRGLKYINEEKVTLLDHLDVDLYASEILGVAGVGGSGQKELCEIISGLKTPTEGKMILKGQDITAFTVRDFIKKDVNIHFVPEDRIGMGLVGSMDMIDNIVLRLYKKQKGFFLNRKPAEEKANQMVKSLKIKTPGIKHPVKVLSGGNLQKVLLGR
ncbi:MAG: ABC transporter ATP-binding protein, partial [Vallitaleaceae bacterium]|nr:ABC transporter ATP-binding protein [Vallitaleaceae bacterium]